MSVKKLRDFYILQADQFAEDVRGSFVFVAIRHCLTCPAQLPFVCVCVFLVILAFQVVP